jgi:hypothetical protein
VKPDFRLVLNPASRLAFRRKAFDPINCAVCDCCADIVAATDGPPLYLEHRLRSTFALRLERIEHIYNVYHFPKAIRYASGHCRANPQRLVKPDEIVIHRVQRDRARVVFDLLRERVCEPRKSAHVPLRPDRKQYIGEPAIDAARRYSPRVVVAVDCTRIVGNPANIATSDVERSNLTLRMASRRFTRLTNGFSKKLENHAAAVVLFVAHYNLCRVHEASR